MARLSLTSIVLATMYALAMAAESAPKANGSAGPVIAAGCEKNLKVVAQADLDSIKSCAIFKGTVSVENMPGTQLKMEGVQQLIGDLIMSGNGALTSFSAPELQKVDGQVKISNHTILSKVEFPKLTEAKTFSLAVLPALEVIAFPAGLMKVNEVRIEDTRAPKVDGFKPETLQSFTLLSNNYMKSFDFSSVKEVTGDILVLGNNHAMSFNADKLASIKTATFFNLADIQMPALAQVKSDISFHENEFLSIALDKLSSVGGTMTIANNNKLTETSFKNLTLVNGALSIGNNSQLNAIDGFPVLSEIHGTVDLAGSFSEYKLPALQDVRGGMRLQTTSNKFGCSEVERKLKGDNIVKGNTWSCTASMQESNMIPTVGQNSGANNPNSNGGSGSSGNMNTSGAAKNALQGSSLLVAAAGLVYILGF